MEVVWKGMETTEREGLDNMDCRAGREEKLKSVVERSRETGTAEPG